MHSGAEETYEAVRRMKPEQALSIENDLGALVD